MRYALRTLLRQPLFALTAVATLALGIGVNSTIFTFANAAFFRALPGIEQPADLVWISSVERLSGRASGVSYPDFADYREATREVFSGLAGFRPSPFSLGTGEPQRIRGQFVSGNYFSTLGVHAAVGRLIEPSDDRPGAAATAVLSHVLWTNRFGANSAIVGSTLTLNGRAFVVVGIASERFSGPALGESADVWVPLAQLPVTAMSERDALLERGASWLRVLARLRDGVSMAGAQGALGAVARQLEHAHPETNEGRQVLVTSAASGLAPDTRGEFIPLTALMLTVTGIVLLIACANVANLLLARGAARSTEMGIRAAIGATRLRLIRQLLGESALLGTAGAIAGLIASFWASDLLLSALPPAEFRGFETGADPRVIVFTAFLTLISVCTFGIVPALAVTRTTLSSRLQRTAGGRSRLQGAFVVAQLALSLVLLLAGGLSLRALHKSRAIDLGFEPAGILTASYDLELQNYTEERRLAFRRELRTQLAAIPGVQRVGLANVPPLSGTMVGTVVSSTDAAGATVESRASMNGIGPGYFETLRLPLVRGRGVSEADVAGAPLVAVVNEQLARNLWGEDIAVGRHLMIGTRRFAVIGVARGSKYDEATEDPRPFLYTSLAQESMLARETVIVRTAVPPASLARAVGQTVRAIDPAMPVFDVRTMDDVLSERADKQQGISVLLGAFGGVALLLASLGLYGVMSYAVTRRTREIGVRIALGATPRQVSALIASDGLRLALIGVAIGGTLSLPMAVAVGALLFGVQIADVASFAGICAMLVGIAVLAAILPARRAARLDPILALRTE